MTNPIPHEVLTYNNYFSLNIILLEEFIKHNKESFLLLPFPKIDILYDKFPKHKPEKLQLNLFTCQLHFIDKTCTKTRTLQKKIKIDVCSHILKLKSHVRKERQHVIRGSFVLTLLYRTEQKRGNATPH